MSIRFSKEQVDFIEENASVYETGDGDKFYHLPVFKKISDDVFEPLTPDKIPRKVAAYIIKTLLV